MISTPTLILLPGLGVDARVFLPQAALPLRVHVAEWIEPESQRETLSHYAARMADRLPPLAESLIGGISLGAIVAVEIARTCANRGVISIGGCFCPSQISPIFRAMLKVGASLPTASIRPILRLAPLALTLAENLRHDAIQLMTQMLREHSPGQIRWSCRALLEWQGVEPTSIPGTHGIHGEKDEVIPVTGLNAQYVVKGGRHLINLSHPHEVNRYILQRASETRNG